MSFHNAPAAEPSTSPVSAGSAVRLLPSRSFRDAPAPSGGTHGVQQVTSVRDYKSQSVNKELNCARNCGHKTSQNYTIDLATQLPSQAKGPASPPQGLSESREMTARPKAGIAPLTLSDREGFTVKKRVWEHVSLPGFHSPWNYSSAPQIGISEHNPRNALKDHQVKAGYLWLYQSKTVLAKSLCYSS